MIMGMTMTIDNKKIIDKIRKLITIAEGNTNSAEMANEAIAAGEMAQRLLEKYKLDISLLSKEEQRIAYIEIGNDLGKTIVENSIKRANARLNNARTVWFEKLAKVIAETYYCKVGFIRKTGAVSIYGYDLDRQIAVLMLEKLTNAANKSCKEEAKKLEDAINNQGISKGISVFSKKVVSLPKSWTGEEEFTNSFHAGFRKAVEEKYSSHRNASLDNAEVETYYNSASREEKEGYSSYIQWQDDNHLNLNEWHDQYVFDLGYNYASKLSTKTSSLVQSKTAKSTALVGTKVKVVFIGNAFLLIDTSGSMNGSRINEAKDGAIKYAKDVLTKGFSPGIITFGAHVYYGSEENQVKLVIDCQDHVNGNFQNIINNLKAGGSTPMTEAIQLATVELMRKKGRKVICIVTDGDPDNVNSAVAAASIAKEQGIEIFAVGVDGARQDVLDQLVSKKGMALLTNNLSGGMQKIAGLLN
jgi:uncharacterized protein YegL